MERVASALWNRIQGEKESEVEGGRLVEIENEGMDADVGSRGPAKVKGMRGVLCHTTIHRTLRIVSLNDCITPEPSTGTTALAPPGSRFSCVYVVTYTVASLDMLGGSVSPIDNMTKYLQLERHTNNIHNNTGLLALYAANESRFAIDDRVRGIMFQSVLQSSDA